MKNLQVLGRIEGEAAVVVGYVNLGGIIILLYKNISELMEKQE